MQITNEKEKGLIAHLSKRRGVAICPNKKIVLTRSETAKKIPFIKTLVQEFNWQHQHQKSIL